MKSPKVSVLIPTYNYGKYLEEAVESVLAQEFENYELIISDDCSSDHTDEIMAQYRDDGRVRYHRHKENLGMVENWNWCLSEAQGEYIKFVFADDKLVFPNGLNHLIAMMDACPVATLAATSRHLINSKSEILETWNDMGKSGIYSGRDVIRRCLEEDRNLIGEPTVTLFRKRDAGAGFNTAYRQLVDLEFWYRLLEKGDLVYSSEASCCFRKHSLQQTQLNRPGAIPQIESIRLSNDYIHRFQGINLSWFYFKKLRSINRIKRNRNIDLQQIVELEKKLSGKISKSGYAACWIGYKVSRLYKELTTIIKRFGRIFCYSDRV